MREIIVSPAVVEDIEQAWLFIARDNRDAADRILEKFQAAIKMLAKHPGAGHSRKDVSDQKYRFWCVKPYLIVYVHDEHVLNVIRILHGSRHIRNFL